MPDDFQPLPGKERASKITKRVFQVSGFIIVAGLVVAVRLAPDAQFIKSRIIPAALFGVVGIGGLANAGLNLWLYRKGGLLQKEVTMHANPARYWLLFAVFTALSIAALTVAVLIATGTLAKKSA
jgi:hypothetical protein